MARRDEILNRISQAAAEQAAGEKELEKLDQLPDFKAMAEGTVFVTVVRLGGRSPYTYIGFKTRGRFYLTGKTGPDGVTDEGLADWLTRPGRTMLMFQELAVVEVEALIVADAFDLAAAMAGAMRERRSGARVSLGIYGYGE